MHKLTATGAAGTAETTTAIRDSRGVGLLPVQADTDGTTFRLLARVSPDAPWVEIKAAGAVDFLESISWVPYLRLEITSGTGTVTVWVGEA